MSGTADDGRLWLRLMKKNRCLKDLVVPCHREDPQNGIRQALADLDISQPMWLPRHHADWEQYALTHFSPDHFMDSVPFDRLEVSFIFSDEKEKPVRKRSPLEDV